MKIINELHVKLANARTALEHGEITRDQYRAIFRSAFTAYHETMNKARDCARTIKQARTRKINRAIKGSLERLRLTV